MTGCRYKVVMKKEYALGLMTVLFWSTSATAFKIALQYLEVLQLLFLSIITSTLILGGYLTVRGKIRQVLMLRPKEYAYYLFLGVLNPLLYYLMVIKAYELLPAQVVQPINYTWVITLSLLCVPLLKQPFTKSQMVSSLICYAGVVILSWRKGNAFEQDISPLGIFLAVSCTIIWALYWIYNVRSKQDPIVAIFLNFIFSIPFVTIACAGFSTLSIPDLKSLGAAVWIGCFEFGFAFITWAAALKTAKNTNYVTSLIFLTPFISLVFIHTVLHEKILLQTYAGLILIISGILIQKYAEFKST